MQHLHSGGKPADAKTSFVIKLSLRELKYIFPSKGALSFELRAGLGLYASAKPEQIKAGSPVTKLKESISGEFELVLASGGRSFEPMTLQLSLVFNKASSNHQIGIVPIKVAELVNSHTSNLTSDFKIEQCPQRDASLRLTIEISPKDPIVIGKASKLQSRSDKQSVSSKTPPDSFSDRASQKQESARSPRSTKPLAKSPRRIAKEQAQNKLPLSKVSSKSYLGLPPNMNHSLHKSRTEVDIGGGSQRVFPESPIPLISENSVGPFFSDTSRILSDSHLDIHLRNRATLPSIFLTKEQGPDAGLGESHSSQISNRRESLEKLGDSASERDPLTQRSDIQTFRASNLEESSSIASNANKLESQNREIFNQKITEKLVSDLGSQLAPAGDRLKSPEASDKRARDSNKQKTPNFTSQNFRLLNSKSVQKLAPLRGELKFYILSKGLYESSPTLEAAIQTETPDVRRNYSPFNILKRSEEEKSEVGISSKSSLLAEEQPKDAGKSNKIESNADLQVDREVKAAKSENADRSFEHGLEIQDLRTSRQGLRSSRNFRSSAQNNSILNYRQSYEISKEDKHANPAQAQREEKLPKSSNESRQNLPDLAPESEKMIENTTNAVKKGEEEKVESEKMNTGKSTEGSPKQNSDKNLAEFSFADKSKLEDSGLKPQKANQDSHLANLEAESPRKLTSHSVGEREQRVQTPITVAIGQEGAVRLSKEYDTSSPKFASGNKSAFNMIQFSLTPDPEASKDLINLEKLKLKLKGDEMVELTDSFSPNEAMKMNLKLGLKNSFDELPEVEKDKETPKSVEEAKSGQESARRIAQNAPAANTNLLKEFDQLGSLLEESQPPAPTLKSNYSMTETGKSNSELEGQGLAGESASNPNRSSLRKLVEGEASPNAKTEKRKNSSEEPKSPVEEAPSQPVVQNFEVEKFEAEVPMTPSFAKSKKPEVDDSITPELVTQFAIDESAKEKQKAQTHQAIDAEDQENFPERTESISEEPLEKKAEPAIQEGSIPKTTPSVDKEREIDTRSDDETNRNSEAKEKDQLVVENQPESDSKPPESKGEEQAISSDEIKNTEEGGLSINPETNQQEENGPQQPIPEETKEDASQQPEEGVKREDLEENSQLKDDGRAGEPSEEKENAEDEPHGPDESKPDLVSNDMEVVKENQNEEVKPSEAIESSAERKLISEEAQLSQSKEDIKDLGDEPPKISETIPKPAEEEAIQTTEQPAAENELENTPERINKAAKNAEKAEESDISVRTLKDSLTDSSLMSQSLSKGNQPENSAAPDAQEEPDYPKSQLRWLSRKDEDVKDSTEFETLAKVEEEPSEENAPTEKLSSEEVDKDAIVESDASDAADRFQRAQTETTNQEVPAHETSSSPNLTATNPKLNQLTRAESATSINQESVPSPRSQIRKEIEPHHENPLLREPLRVIYEDSVLELSHSNSHDNISASDHTDTHKGSLTAGETSAHRSDRSKQRKVSKLIKCFSMKHLSSSPSHFLKNIEEAHHSSAQEGKFGETQHKSEALIKSKPELNSLSLYRKAQTNEFESTNLSEASVSFMRSITESKPHEINHDLSENDETPHSSERNPTFPAQRSNFYQDSKPAENDEEDKKSDQIITQLDNLLQPIISAKVETLNDNEKIIRKAFEAVACSLHALRSDRYTTEEAEVRFLEILVPIFKIEPPAIKSFDEAINTERDDDEEITYYLTHLFEKLEKFLSNDDLSDGSIRKELEHLQNKISKTFNDPTRLIHESSPIRESTSHISSDEQSKESQKDHIEDKPSHEISDAQPKFAAEDKIEGDPKESESVSPVIENEAQSYMASLEAAPKEADPAPQPEAETEIDPSIVEEEKKMIEEIIPKIGTEELSNVEPICQDTSEQKKVYEETYENLKKDSFNELVAESSNRADRSVQDHVEMSEANLEGQKENDKIDNEAKTEIEKEELKEAEKEPEVENDKLGEDQAEKIAEPEVSKPEEEANQNSDSRDDQSKIELQNEQQSLEKVEKEAENSNFDQQEANQTSMSNADLQSKKAIDDKTPIAEDPYANQGEPDAKKDPSDLQNKLIQQVSIEEPSKPSLSNLNDEGSRSQIAVSFNSDYDKEKTLDNAVSDIEELKQDQKDSQQGVKPEEPEIQIKPAKVFIKSQSSLRGSRNSKEGISSEDLRSSGPKKNESHPSEDQPNDSHFQKEEHSPPIEKESKKDSIPPSIAEDHKGSSGLLGDSLQAQKTSKSPITAFQAKNGREGTGLFSHFGAKSPSNLLKSPPIKLQLRSPDSAMSGRFGSKTGSLFDNADDQKFNYGLRSPNMKLNSPPSNREKHPDHRNFSTFRTPIHRQEEVKEEVDDPLAEIETKPVETPSSITLSKKKKNRKDQNSETQPSDPAPESVTQDDKSPESKEIPTETEKIQNSNAAEEIGSPEPAEKVVEEPNAELVKVSPEEKLPEDNKEDNEANAKTDLEAEKPHNEPANTEAQNAESLSSEEILGDKKKENSAGAEPATQVEDQKTEIEEEKDPRENQTESAGDPTAQSTRAPQEEEISKSESAVEPLGQALVEKTEPGDEVNPGETEKQEESCQVVHSDHKEEESAVDQVEGTQNPKNDNKIGGETASDNLNEKTAQDQKRIDSVSEVETENAKDASDRTAKVDTNSERGKENGDSESGRELKPEEDLSDSQSRIKLQQVDSSSHAQEESSSKKLQSELKVSSTPKKTLSDDFFEKPNFDSPMFVSQVTGSSSKWAKGTGRSSPPPQQDQEHSFRFAKNYGYTHEKDSSEAISPSKRLPMDEDLVSSEKMFKETQTDDKETAKGQREIQNAFQFDRASSRDKNPSNLKRYEGNSELNFEILSHKKDQGASEQIRLQADFIILREAKRNPEQLTISEPFSLFFAAQIRESQPVPQAQSPTELNAITDKFEKSPKSIRLEEKQGSEQDATEKPRRKNNRKLALEDENLQLKRELVLLKKINDGLKQDSDGLKSEFKRLEAELNSLKEQHSKCPNPDCEANASPSKSKAGEFS